MEGSNSSLEELLFCLGKHFNELDYQGKARPPLPSALRAGAHLNQERLLPLKRQLKICGASSVSQPLGWGLICIWWTESGVLNVLQCMGLSCRMSCPVPDDADPCDTCWASSLWDVASQSVNYGQQDRAAFPTPYRHPRRDTCGGATAHCRIPSSPRLWP